MFARTVRLVAALGLGVVLVGCSSTPPVSSPTRASVPLPDQVHAGEGFAIRDQQGRKLVTASIDLVRVDANCFVRSPVRRQLDQHRLAILMTFDTTANYQATGMNLAGPPESPDFRIAGPGGEVDKTVRPLGKRGCAGEEGVFGNRLEPSTRYQGWVLMQTEFAGGTLYYRPQGAMSLPGWEIHFPAGRGE